MRIQQLNHVALHVTDLAASMKFYGEVLELPILPRPNFDFKGAWYGLGPTQELHLVDIPGREPPKGMPRRHHHFAVQVANVWDAKRELEWKGFFKSSEPKPRPDGVMQLFVTDPDGYLIELYSLPEKPVEVEDRIGNGLTADPERVGDWVQVYSGGKFYPMDPRPEEVDITDIAHSLANMCRFNGHTDQFYSVAEHCCHVHDILAHWTEMSGVILLRGLLHDASEAYICDIPRPLKKHPGWPQMYHDAEEKIMQAVATRFGFTWPMDEFTEAVDDLVLGTEFEQVMRPNTDRKSSIGDRFKPIKGLTLQCWAPPLAEHEFTKRFKNLVKNS